MIKKLFSLPVAAAVLLALTAGQCTDRKTGGADLKVFCRTEVPACWSQKDTDETIRWAKGHNAIGKKFCGWTPKSHPCRKG